MKSVQISFGAIAIVALIPSGVDTTAAGDSKATSDTHQALISQEQA